MNLDYLCGTCDKRRDGCDFCLGTNTGDGSREELMTEPGDAS